MAIEIPLAGAEYEFAPFATQRSMNIEPIGLEAKGKTVFRMVQTPGLEAFATVTGAPRGLWRIGSMAYAVHGTTLYSVDSAGVTASLGTVGGSGFVSMTSNSRYLVIVNGADGYYYDTQTATFSIITDLDFRPADFVLYLDGYFVFKETGTTNVFISGLNDPSTFDATDVQSKGGDPNGLRTIRAIQGDLMLLGETHSYFWRNTGNVDFPFENVDGAEMERGCIAKFSAATIDNSIIFLGDDRIVYWVDGYVPTRASNYMLEEFLSSLSLAQCEAAYAFAYTQSGRYYYCLTVGGKTWVYNRTESLLRGQSLWHERSSKDTVWRARTHVEAHGKHLVGDEGKIWSLNPKVWTEGDDRIKRVRRITPIWNEDEYFGIGRLKLDAKVGTGTLTDPPDIHMRSSKDGFTWNDWKTRTSGKLGQYMTQLIWRRLGWSKMRSIEFAWDSDAEIELGRLYVE